MIYRQHAYSVVQTANPVGWTWTVQLDGSRSRTGESHGRESAVVAARSAIDNVFKTAVRPDAVSHQIVDGRLIAKRAM